MVFGDDWPGLFLRGDNAVAFAMALSCYMDGDRNFLSVVRPLEEYLEDLRSCNEPAQEPVQRLKPFEECLPK